MLRATAVIALTLAVASPGSQAMVEMHQGDRLDLRLPAGAAQQAGQFHASRSMGSRALPPELRRREGLPVHRIAATTSVDSPASRFRADGFTSTYLGFRLDAQGLRAGFAPDALRQLLPEGENSSVRVSPANELR